MEAAHPIAVEGQRSPVTRVAIGLLALGAVLRLGQYASFRSLWLDEAMLAVNIAGRNFGELLRPLGDSQAAPWLFLWIERAAIAAFGPTEAALRILPLISGLILPVLVWVIARKVDDEKGAAVVAGLAALSPLLIYYSNEAKPYGLDGLVAAAMVLLTLNLAGASARGAWLFVGAGVLAVISSLTAVFVLPACWVAILLDARIAANRKRTVLLAAPLFWGAMFACQYFVGLRAARGDGFFALFFRDRFLPVWARWREIALDGFIGQDAAAAMPNALVTIVAIALLALVVVGARAVHRSRGVSTVVLLTGPIVLALMAAALRIYPILPRLWVFSAPLLAVLIGVGIHHTVRMIRNDAPTFALTTVAAVILALPAYDAFLTFNSPYWRRTHIRPLLTSVHDSASALREPVYVSPHAVSQWIFYTFPWKDASLPTTNRDSLRQWYEETSCSRTTASSAACLLIGRYSGLQYSEGGSFSGAIAAGWADAEMTRLKDSSTPCGWVFMHLPLPGEPLALAQGIQSAGGNVVSALEDRVHTNRETNTRAFHVCFPSKLTPGL